MKKAVFLIPVLVFIAAFSFAQEEAPPSILNNQFYQQSVSLNEQAKIAFEEGDYDASAAYAEQAAEYAKRSDDYVAMRLSDNTFGKAHSRYTWASSVGAAKRYPSEFQTATSAYYEAVQFRQAEDWDNVADASNRVLAALANVRGPGGETGPASKSGKGTAPSTLPAQYTVRRWVDTGDCFSTIAGWSWVYGDSSQWRKLYEANKSKLPNPNNPNLILPGMIMDIPSIGGETRSGMWDPEAKY